MPSIILCSVAVPTALCKTTAAARGVCIIMCISSSRKRYATLQITIMIVVGNIMICTYMYIYIYILSKKKYLIFRYIAYTVVIFNTKVHSKYRCHYCAINRFPTIERKRLSAHA